MTIKNQSLSILLITNNYRPYCSGVANSLEQLHKELINQGHNAYIVTLDFLGDKNYEENIIRLYSPIRFTYKKNPMAIPLLPYHELKKIITKIKPDIIHVHHPFLLGKVGLEIAKNFDIPILFTYHTQYDKYLHYIPLPEKITEPIILKWVNDFCNKVDGIIVPCQTIKNCLESRNIVKPVIMVIPSSIDPFYITSVPKISWQNPIQLLTMSRFVKEKNIEFLLRVMQLLDPQRFHLTLIGYGPYQEFLQQYAFDKLELTAVTFITKPSKEERAQYYKKADIFIFASLTETQGLVLAEAMASGTPVVALDASGSRDIIKNGYNGFLVENEEQMINTILSITHNQEQLVELSKNASKTAQEYKPENLTKKVIDIYRELINR